MKILDPAGGTPLDSFFTAVYAWAADPAALFFLLLAASLANTFFPPVPIEAATLFAGYTVAAGHGSLMIVIAGTVAGMTLGGWALYGIARMLGPRILSVPLVNTMVTEERYGKAAAWFRAYGIGTLFLSKLVPGMHFCAVVSAGILRMDWRAALLGILGSNIVMFAFLAYFGKLTGDHWRQAYQALGTAGLATVTALAAAIAAGALFRKFRRRAGK